jgi:glucose-1-phosphate adenylyltransferase
MQQKEMIAMILAGGQGSRLGVLTKKVAKPAVYFGGKYRIIDFPLSNCSNSGIYTVGILTQYRPQVLNAHIGIGSPWDLDRSTGGVSILPPYMREYGGNWYKGTADAIYQNRHYVDSFNPEYVLILSGDHIYKMDYSKLLQYHKKVKADATIGVIRVPLNEASRFGIMNTDSDNKVYEFDEKPKHPKNDMASMGIYIFNWKLLRRFLSEDASDESSSNDFGKNIIPKMLAAGKSLYAYPFEDYWKDVGTIESLWEANMDLLKEDNSLNIYDQSWKIYSVNPTKPPQYIGPDAEISCSIIPEGCRILGKVKNSVLFPGVFVGKGSTVEDSVIMPNTSVGEKCAIRKAVVGSGVVIHDEISVGDGEEIIVVGDNSVVKAGEPIVK